MGETTHPLNRDNEEKQLSLVLVDLLHRQA